jgi:NADH:ubiquinone oxidoreductase subunit 4 (subunit M)
LRREKFVIVPVTLLMFAVGIAPQFVLNIFSSTIARMARLFV